MKKPKFCKVFHKHSMPQLFVSTKWEVNHETQNRAGRLLFLYVRVSNQPIRSAAAFCQKRLDSHAVNHFVVFWNLLNWKQSRVHILQQNKVLTFLCACLILLVTFFFSGTTAQRGPVPPHSWGFEITHNDTPQSVELLWTGDRPVAGTLPDNTQHSQETDSNAPGGTRSRNPIKRALADLHLRPPGRWDRRCLRLPSSLSTCCLNVLLWTCCHARVYKRAKFMHRIQVENFCHTDVFIACF